MYLRQMEDYSRPVTLELEKDIFKRKKVLFVCYVDKKMTTELRKKRRWNLRYSFLNFLISGLNDY